MKKIELPYFPRPVQSAVHKNLKRFSVVIAHRRMGKTVLALNELIVQAIKSKRERPRFAYLAPLYRQAKQTAWDLLRHYTRVIPGIAYNESELRADFPNGARITLYGADNYDALRGIYLDGVVLDEYAHMSSKTWTEVIRPALIDRTGWALFIGTPSGHNALYTLFTEAKGNPSWYADLFPASRTGVIPEKELANARSSMTPEEYAQEFEVSFEAAIRGAIYAKEMARLREDHHICSIPVEPHIPVDTAYDLGWGDLTTVIFFQRVGKEVRIIDYEERSHTPLPDLVALLKEKGYVYGTQFLPHDAKQSRLEAAGKSIQAQLWDLGLQNIVVTPQMPVEHGISLVRTLFPRLWIDGKKCQSLIEALVNYRRHEDERHRIFGAPEHDIFSHGSDALRTLALGFEEQLPLPDRTRLRPFDGFVKDEWTL